MNLSKLFNEFFNGEKAGGLLLVFVTLLSITIAKLILRQAGNSEEKN